MHFALINRFCVMFVITLKSRGEKAGELPTNRAQVRYEMGFYPISNCGMMMSSKCC